MVKNIEYFKFYNVHSNMTIKPELSHTSGYMYGRITNMLHLQSESKYIFCIWTNYLCPSFKGGLVRGLKLYRNNITFNLAGLYSYTQREV